MKKKQSEISEELILECAWSLLKEEGIEKFSMRRLADKLGIQAPSLYWYFKSKQNIYQRLANQISKIIVEQFQGEGCWKEQLRGIARTTKDVLCRYPCSTQIMMMTLPMEQDIIRLNNRMLLCVDHTPLEEKQKLQVVLTLMNYVFNFVLDRYQHEQNVVTMMSNDVDEASNEETMVSLLESMDETEAGVFKRMTKDNIFNEMGSEDAFEFGLNLILLGVEQVIQEKLT